MRHKGSVYQTWMLRLHHQDLSQYLNLNQELEIMTTETMEKVVVRKTSRTMAAIQVVVEEKKHKLLLRSNNILTKDHFVIP
jgi:hypothetical protein